MTSPSHSHPALETPIGMSSASAASLTQAEFMKQAHAVRLHQHGRRWEVFFCGRSIGFSDDATEQHALEFMHRAAVNNVLWTRSSGNRGAFVVEPMPAARVMAAYPYLLEKFAATVDFARVPLALRFTVNGAPASGFDAELHFTEWALAAEGRCPTGFDAAHVFQLARRGDSAFREFVAESGVAMYCDEPADE